MRVGTPASRSRRPGSRYFATLPATTTATATPSTVQPTGSLRGTAQTAIPASTSSSPGSTGISTPSDADHDQHPGDQRLDPHTADAPTPHPAADARA